MKRFLAAALLLVGSLSVADTRLEYRQIPLRTMGAKMELTTIVVLDSGLVLLQKQSPTAKFASVKLAELDAYEMDRLDGLIETARTGKIVKDPFHALCFVAPFMTSEYTADNRKVFLQSGDICTGVTRNTSPEAKELVGELVKFLQQANGKQKFPNQAN